MTQNEAMHMSNEQAVQILKPMRDMMRDQHGCPISDAYFAIEKAIRVLTTISPDEVRGVGEWSEDRMDYRCSVCGKSVKDEIFYMFEPYQMPPYCPNCGARMKGAEDGTTDN